MVKLLKFLTSKSSFLLFVFLELIALVLIIKTHNYAQVKTHSFQTALAGSIHNKLSVVEQHLNLKKNNSDLLKQNAALLTQLQQNEARKITPVLNGQFEFIPAYAVTNQYNLTHNTLIINKGRVDGVKPEMGVIGVNGVVGIVQKTSENYARVISVLNRDSKLNVALNHTNYTGFMQWKDDNPNEFSIIDMPVDAPLKTGDTIITSGMSSVFPKGIAIGKIIDFETVPGRKSYKINIKTFMDMTNIGPVYVVKNKYKKQIDSLLQ
jgi:rod shape-determining protein MreC